MLSNESVISTSSPLISDTSMSLSANSSGTDGLVDGLTELVRIATNITTLWAPAAMLNADTSFNTTLLANSSDNWESFGPTIQLDDCFPAFKCFNWTNYTQSESDRNNGTVEPTKSVHSVSDISANISANNTTNYTIDNESTTFATFFTNNDSRVIDTIVFEADGKIHHPILALFLAIICIIVVFGNTLTMLSVYRERYLHTVTNYFVASLAVSDCLVGAVVMPFSVIYETMNKLWIFGEDWCDLWHSFDVLASTASILNLCVISLDRYWAITDPFTYPSRMTPNRAAVFIAFLWICSALISFPAILWWRAVQKEPMPPFECRFTDDVGYLVFSSTISFYGPLTVMVFTYAKIYFIASKQTRSLKLGAKQIQSSSSCDTGNNNAITLRMHKGGYNTGIPRHKYSSDSGDEHNPDLISAEENEKKAAKTLGIVMGVFILCWMPFFVTNILMGICQSCVYEPDLVGSVVTWLGWINSALNPVIYACWSRDFRRAFAKILFSCCSSNRRRRQNLAKQNRLNSFMVRDGKHLAKRRSNEEVGLNSLDVIRSRSCDDNRLAVTVITETIPL